MSNGTAMDGYGNLIGIPAGFAKDSCGNLRRLQTRDPIDRPDDVTEPDCAYCTRKNSCSNTRQFFVGENYQPCNSYNELNEQRKKDARLKELAKVFDPSPRPEGTVEDCLFCKLLRKKMGIFCSVGWPKQGQGQICRNYCETKARSESEPKHCLCCLENFSCERGRVVRDGQPCERYVELTPEVTEKAG
jgi:hypothetical protein